MHKLCWALLLLPLMALAADDPNVRQKALQSQISVVLKELESEKNRYSALEKKLAGLERNIQQQAKRLRELDLDVEKGQQRILRLTRQQADQQQALQAQQSMLAKQLRASWVAGNQEQLQLWLSGGDVKLFGPVLTWYDYLNRNRVGNVVDLANEVELLAQTGRELTEADVALRRLRDEERENAAKLKATQQQRSALLAASGNKIHSEQEQLKKLQLEQKQLTALIARLKEAAAKAPPIQKKTPAVAFSKLTGKLRWPVKGKIVHDYGEPRADGRLKWNGVTIKAKRGSKVHSVATGEVIFADWLGRLGLLMIVDHGNDYLALYGHNQALYKEPGEHVAAGELIASVGDSGGRTESALYFEVRKGSGFRNPHMWCKKTAL